MIVHIFNDQQKFSRGYFQMLSDHEFELSDQVLFHYGKRDSFFDNLGVTTHFLRSWFLPHGHLQLLAAMRRADHIVVHSMAAPMLVLSLALLPNLGRKVTWVIWGKDLYLYAVSRHKSVPLRVYEIFRKKAIRNIGHVVTGFDEDYQELRRLYETRASNTSCTLLYPYNVQRSGAIPIQVCAEPYVVLLGNSASTTNDHIEMLQWLSLNDKQIAKVIVPLSYGGSRRYVRRVVKEGRRLFTDRFVPVTGFMEASAYYALISQVDVAVFNHKRQEAFNNICTLILGGVTVYLNAEISTAGFMKRLGVVVGDCRDIAQEGLHCTSGVDRTSNALILSAELDVARSVEKWRNILRV